MCGKYGHIKIDCPGMFESVAVSSPNSKRLKWWTGNDHVGGYRLWGHIDS